MLKLSFASVLISKEAVISMNIVEGYRNVVDLLGVNTEGNHKDKEKETIE